ncbi:MAG: hypothetical protein VB118_03410 [Oscillospiraceae bacterium]|nr:hypothetical protein [Oscillospiraceae bacterium]
MKKSLFKFLALLALISILISSCGPAGNTGDKAKFDLSSATGIYFVYSDFGYYLMDESNELSDKVLTALSTCMSGKFDEISVEFPENLSDTDEVKAMLESKERIEVLFPAPVTLKLTKTDGSTFVLNDYDRIIVAVDSNEIYLSKNGVYSTGKIKTVDTSAIKQLIKDNRDYLYTLE